MILDYEAISASKTRSIRNGMIGVLMLLLAGIDAYRIAASLKNGYVVTTVMGLTGMTNRAVWYGLVMCAMIALFASKLRISLALGSFVLGFVIVFLNIGIAWKAWIWQVVVTNSLFWSVAVPSLYQSVLLFGVVITVCNWLHGRRGSIELWCMIAMCGLMLDDVFARALMQHLPFDPGRVGGTKDITNFHVHWERNEYWGMVAWCAMRFAWMFTCGVSVCVITMRGAEKQATSTC